MNPHQLLRLFPNASKSVLDANKSDYGSSVPETDPETKGSRKAPKLERPARDGAVGTAQSQEADAKRVLVRFVSVRKRLLDPDNIAEKWMLDCLRFARVIRGDEPEKIALETTQRKTAKNEEEHTEITVFEL